MCIFLNLKPVAQKKIRVRNNSNNLFGWRMFALIQRLKIGAKIDIQCKMQAGGWVNSILSTLLQKILKVSEAPEDSCAAQQLKLTFISREREGEMKPSLWDVADFQSARDQKQQHDCCWGNCLVQLINQPPSQEHRLFYRQKKTSLFFFRKINSKEEDLFMRWM